MAGSDIKSIMSALSKSDISTVAEFKMHTKLGLHELCSTYDMSKFQEAFEGSYSKKFTPTQFKLLIKKILNVEYEDEEYKLLFLKINTNRDGEICWDELVSHLLLGYFEQDPDNQRETLTLPIIGLPRVMKSKHRHSISRVCFCPDVSKDRSIGSGQGVYLTASRDGTVNWWSLDMTLLRTAVSTCPHLKVQTTWVTDMTCMPDVNIVVTSSTERDLRFYDCTAKTFTLKIVISSWEYMICTMHYHFHQDISEKSILICGDAGGNVRIIQFSPVLRGPFQNKPERALLFMRHIDLQRGRFLEMKLTEYKNVHTDWVRQVSFYSSLHCFVSCATCPNALLMCDLNRSKTYNMFHVLKGIQCFAFDEDAHALATGGPDCTVRLWNAFVSQKPSLVLIGHHAGIVSIILQSNASKIYSISRDRVIKVWDVQAQTCLQTYIDIPSTIGEKTPLSVLYNSTTRELIMASIQIATITLDEILNPDHTDGFTHSKGISKVLYNPLFKIVVTCGHDSIFICWDPLTGKRMSMVREAHTRLLRGELVPVEITAACFDPGYQLLLTGARDGSLKVWNFNTGICLRNMCMQHNSEVTAVYWVEGRMLAVGWNRHVTEFEEGGTALTGKAWETRHSEDVLASAARPPLSLATTSYNGEMVLWKLETGQPYRRFSCKDPTVRIKMSYSKKDLKGANASQVTEGGPMQLSITGLIGTPRESMISGKEAMAKARARRMASSPPQREISMRPLAVHAAIFLTTREQVSSEGTLLISLENGQIQCWSDHPAGGYKGSFQAVHTTGDYVTSLDTDEDNEFLFTGTTVGYVKIWHMFNYITNKKVHVSMPRLRLMFPFLWRDRMEGRAKRCLRDQPVPLLLSSYRAHLRSVTSIAYLPHFQFVVTGSSDYSARLWRLSGEYLQTFGSFVPWTTEVTRHPPDVKKVASFTTLKVWNGGEVSRYTPGQKVIDHLRDITADELRKKTYGSPVEEPLLGSYFQLPKRPDIQEKIVLDDSLPTIPLYTHLRLASTQPVCRPPTPELVRQTRLKAQRHKTRPVLHFQSQQNISKEKQRTE